MDEKSNEEPKRDSSNSSLSNDKARPNPLRFAYLIIHHPCRIIAAFIAVFIIVLIIDWFAFEFKSTDTHVYFVLSDRMVNRMDNLNLAIDYLSKSSSNVAVKTLDESKFQLIVMFHTENGDNILSPSSVSDYIEFINKTNMQIPYTDYNDYYSLCLADASQSSYPDCSSSAIYDPIVSKFSSYDYINESDIEEFISDNLNNPYTKTAFLACFEENFENTSYATYYRAFYKFGLPYPDIGPEESSFRDSEHGWDDQEQYYSDYIFPIFQKLQITDNDDKHVRVVIYGRSVRSMQRKELTFEGVTFAMGSVGTVFLIMVWHLNSLFLATAAMIQIISGFPFAFFLYRYIFQCTFFEMLNTLVVFLILGIGADDVFVFTDAWIQSIHFVANPDDLVERMSFAYRRASKAMIVTTATTFFAFIATAFSPIMPIAAFGLWAASVVLMNYVMVITLFPSLLSWWYQHIKEKEKLPFTCPWKKKTNNNNTVVNNTSETQTKNKNEKQTAKSIELQNRESNISENKREVASSSIFSLTQTAGNGVDEARCLERILRDQFANLVIKLRYFIVIFTLILMCLSAWQASQLGPLTEEEEWFSGDHYMTQMITWQEKFTGGAVTTLIKERFVWGLKEWVDRSGVSQWADEDNYGKVQFDESFDMSSAVNQEFLYYVCDSLMTDYADLLYDVNDHFDCWIYDFEDYGVNDLGLNFPFVFDNSSAKIQSKMFNELLSNWTRNNAIGARYLGEGQVGFDGINQELKFFYLEFRLPWNRYVPLATKDKLYKIWENIFDDFMDEAPEGVDNGYQISAFAWAWAASETGFVVSAVQGIGIALPVALVCLILSTHNWIVSVFATSAIVGIILTEVALMVLMGWELGISESIAIVMMIGFSVDYVVHLGNAYEECDIADNRFEKIKFALYTMGISVISGALTTFGSGFWLIFPEMLFFAKFGILVMSVVAWSLFFSMIYFVAIMSILGPTGKTGEVPIGKLIAFVTPKKKHPLVERYCFCFGTIDNYYDMNPDDKNNQPETPDTPNDNIELGVADSVATNQTNDTNETNQEWRE